LDSAHPGTIYAGTGEPDNSGDSYAGTGIYRSRDGGVSWAKVTTPASLDGCSVGAIAVSPDGTVIVAGVVSSGVGAPTGCGAGGLYRSVDAGKSFKLAKTTNGAALRGSAWAVVSDLANPSLWYVTGDFGAIGPGVFKSTDTGAHFSRVGAAGRGLPTKNVGRVAIAMAPSRDSTLYAAFGSASTSNLLGIFMSNDAGTSWTRLAKPAQFCNLHDEQSGATGQCNYDLALVVDPSTPTTFYAAGVKLFRYQLSGAVEVPSAIGFGPKGIHVDFHALAFDTSGGLWIGSDGGVYRTVDKGATFNDLNAGLAISEFDPGLSGSSSLLLGGLQDNGTVMSTTQPSWTQVKEGDGGYSAVDPSDPTHLVTTTQNGSLWETHDAGSTFSNITPLVGGVPWGGDPVQFFQPVVMAPADQVLMAGTDRLWANSTGTWSPTNTTPATFGSTVTAIGVAHDNDQNLYVGTASGQLWASTDGGSTWPASFLAPRGPITAITVDPSDDATAYASTGGFCGDTGGAPCTNGQGHVFMTSDAGATWTDVSGDLPNIPVGAVAVDCQGGVPQVYVGTDIGVFEAASGSPGHWLRLNNGLPTTIVMSLLVDDTNHLLVAATHGRGAYVLPITPAPPAQQAKLTASDGSPGVQFGSSVALSGLTALVGSPFSSTGSAYVFARSGLTWTQQAELTAADATPSEQFGGAVALSGSTAVVGAIGQKMNTGAAYVFVRTGTTWTQQAELNASDGAQLDSFGVSVAMSGSTVVVGAYGKNSNTGSAYVFVRTGTTWTQQAELTASDIGTGAYFGVSAAVSGSTAVIGAGERGSTSQAAYVFVRSGTTWTQQAKLIGSDTVAHDSFGSAVALSGSTAVVGAFDHAQNGAAYVFVRSGTAWTQQAELTASNGAPRDYFGLSVAVEQSTAVIGAVGKNSVAGAAYVFTRSGTSWSQQAQLAGTDTTSGDFFGGSMALCGCNAIVGANQASSSAGAAYAFSMG
jgi:FG-GAP repeat